MRAVAGSGGRLERREARRAKPVRVADHERERTEQLSARAEQRGPDLDGVGRRR
jgi:hypothetical protein